MFNLMGKPIHYILTNKQVILKVILLLLVIGGIFVATATYHDYINDVDITKSKDIQILTKEAIQIEQGKTFLWIFSKSDLSVIDIQEINNYEVVIDEETNGTSTFEVLKNTGAESGDIVCFKKDENILYWGIIDEITNENGGIKYTYQCKYITNIFDYKVTMNQPIENELFFMSWIKYANFSFLRNTSFSLDYDDEDNIILKESNGSTDQMWYFDFTATSSTNIPNTHKCYIKNVGTGLYLSTSGVASSQLYLDNQPYVWYVKFNYETIETSTRIGYETIVNADYKPIEILLEDIADGTPVYLGEEELYRDCYKVFLKQTLVPYMVETGIEDFIKQEIRWGYQNDSPYYDFLTIPTPSTHTPKTIGIENDNGLFNLHTLMNNATQNYGITYTFSVGDSEYGHILNLDIANTTSNKVLIDTNAQNISNYQEVFTTNIVAQVICNTSTYRYILYLKTDRTTTTDSTDPNLAEGTTEVIYTENYEDAPQECLNVIQKNQYNHNISFSYDKYIPVGTPIAIKTKNQAIENTYISSIKFSKNKFYQYECGNIRMNFIDKLLKERK